MGIIAGFYKKSLMVFRDDSLDDNDFIMKQLPFVPGEEDVDDEEEAAEQVYE